MDKMGVEYRVTTLLSVRELSCVVWAIVYDQWPVNYPPYIILNQVPPRAHPPPQSKPASPSPSEHRKISVTFGNDPDWTGVSFEELFRKRWFRYSFIIDTYVRVTWLNVKYRVTWILAMEYESQTVLIYMFYIL